MTTVRLRLTARHHRELERHLFPGDGKEAVAVALCGRGAGLDSELVLVHEVHLILHDECRRGEMELGWSPTVLEPLLTRAAREDLAILKIHSHPNGYADFSATDDESDQRVFASVFGWVDSCRPHVSAVMLPGGRIFGRSVFPEGEFGVLESVLVVGPSVAVYGARNVEEDRVDGFTERHAQLFGAGTTNLLRRLRFAVVGCSGTGSPVIEQLARLGAGELVLVDADRVEERNLNRIIGASRADIGRFKVDVLKDHVERMQLGTRVHSFRTQVEASDALAAVASSDFVVGCVDSLSGRHVLSRLAQFYLLPYVDVGVKLEALGDGTINQVAGAVHYLSPDGRDFIERGVFTREDLEADDLLRTNPGEYAELRARGYVRGVRVDRPAVVSVNTVFAGLAVTEVMARLHPFRMDDNERVEGVSLSLSHLQLEAIALVQPPDSPRRGVGRGATRPALGMPSLGVGGV